MKFQTLETKEAVLDKGQLTRAGIYSEGQKTCADNIELYHDNTHRILRHGT